MTSHEYILYRRNTLQLAMAGIGALVICFGMWAATQAEQEFKRQDLAMQEASVSWK